MGLAKTLVEPFSILASSNPKKDLLLKEVPGLYSPANSCELLASGKVGKYVPNADFIFPCAYAVANDEKSRGIILGGSGQGEAMAANRVKGIRAAVFYNGPEDIIKLSRQHNNANVVVLPGQFIPNDMAYKIVRTFMDTRYDQW